MNKKILFAAGSMLALLSTAATAAEFRLSKVYPSWFSYSYAELEYVDMDEGFSGLSAGISFDVKPNWNVIGEYLSTSSSKNGIDLDYRVIAVGGGYHYQLKNLEKSDLMFHAALLQGKSEWVVGNHKADDKDSGLRLGARLRFEPQRNLEVNADLSYNSLFDNDLTFTPAVLYSINSQLAVKAAFEFGDRDMLSIGVRYYIR